MAGHTAFPELQGIEWVRDVVLRFVEENITKPPAEHHAEKRHQRDEIRDGVRLEFAVAARRQTLHHQIGAIEAHHVSEAIPVEPDTIRKVDDVRAEVVEVITEHPDCSQRPLGKSNALLVTQMLSFLGMPNAGGSLLLKAYFRTRTTTLPVLRHSWASVSSRALLAWDVLRV